MLNRSSTAKVFGSLGAILGFRSLFVAKPSAKSAPPSRADQSVAATLAAIDVLARTSAEQATAMQMLAEMTAENMRSATGAFVFQLRDRFDDALPATAMGVGEHSWRAVPSEDLSAEIVSHPAGVHDEIDDSALDLVDQLVFHAGDHVRFVARFVCNQAPVRRTMNVIVVSASEELTVAAPRCRTATHAGIGESFEVAQDVSTFVELAIDVEAGSLAHGLFQFDVAGHFELTNRRPEGSIATVEFGVVLRGVVVPDDDGVGVELLSVEANLGLEHRTYWLDKAARLELALPGAAVKPIKASPPPTGQYATVSRT